MAPPKQPPPGDGPDYDAGWEEFEPRDCDDDWGDNEPIGSCDLCGTNLYPDDEWDGLCNQCSWSCEQNKGGGGGIQPIT